MYQIMIWNKENFYNDKPDHGFTADNGRQVVGLMKTIMDNFKPGRIEVYESNSFEGCGFSDITQFVMIKEIEVYK